MPRYGWPGLKLGIQAHRTNTNRTHTVCPTSEAFHDTRFKLVAHIMSNLPSVTIECNLEQCKKYSEIPTFCSDGWSSQVPVPTHYREQEGSRITHQMSSLMSSLACILTLVPHLLPFTVSS